jgi:hypothetical protein
MALLIFTPRNAALESYAEDDFMKHERRINTLAS